MKIESLLIAAIFFCFSCGPQPVQNAPEVDEEMPATTQKAAKSGKFRGSFSNGYKETFISFEVEDNRLKDLTFDGYWRCDGSIDRTTLGPEKSFDIVDGQVNGVIVEPEDGPAPFRYELHGNIDGNLAQGTLRISNIPANCDTYKLEWTAEKE